MTIDEARSHIGYAVVYHRGTGSQHEHGVITGVHGRYVFVRYLGDEGGRATDPADLTLLAGKVAGDG